MEAVNGVVSVVPGYAGGTTPNPTYRQVCTGATGHAEVVKVEFDPLVISYASLLRIFMTMHNPAQRNAQERRGGQYRSVIFFNSIEQKETAKGVVGKMQSSFDAPVLTEVAPLAAFHEAGRHHRGYYQSDPLKAYCRTVIAPKLKALRQQFLPYLKTVPVT